MRSCRLLPFFLWLAWITIPGAAPATPEATDRPTGEAEVASPGFALPGEEPRALAHAAVLEAEGELLAAARAFEAVALSSKRAEPCWRAARSYWRHAELAFLNGSDQSLGFVSAAERLADLGLTRDPACGACALWKYAAMGRLAPDRGFVWAARHAREMKSLLERGLAARPTHRDANGNSTLANLYYASAVFHRMVPEWFWLPLVAGVRGDTDRSLREIQQAIALSGDRVDYHVEHGAILLCMGSRRRSPDRIGEGVAVLRRAALLPARFATDPVDQAYARQLIEQPRKACAFSRIGFIDVEAEGRRVAGRR